MAQSIERFLDENGKLKQWPAKQAMRLLVCGYLAEKFACDALYTEQDVNAILSSWHTFGDYFVLRRAMVENGYLSRLPDGSRYWKNKEQQGNETI